MSATCALCRRTSSRARNPAAATRLDALQAKGVAPMARGQAQPFNCWPVSAIRQEDTLVVTCLKQALLGRRSGQTRLPRFRLALLTSAEVAPELVDRGHMGPISSHIPSPSSPQLLSTPGRTQARSAQVEPEMVGPKCLGAAGYNGPCCTWALERLFGPNPRPWSTFVRLWQLFALRAQHRPMLVDVVNSGSNVAIPERCRRISDSPMWAALVQVWGSHVLFT